MDKIINKITVDSHAQDKVQVMLALSVATALVFIVIFENEPPKSAIFMRVFWSQQGRKQQQQKEDNNNTNINLLLLVVCSQILEWLFLRTNL